jgi:hypothetical protein
MKSIDGFEKRLDALGAGMARSGPSQETREFLARFTIEEIIQVSDIWTRIENLGGDCADANQYTTEEQIYLLELLSRPILPLPPTDWTKPTCRACGGQPTLSEDNDRCDDCYRAAGGYFDLDQFVRDGHATRNEHGTIQLWVS